MTTAFRIFINIFLILLLIPSVLANPNLIGCWRFDPALSSPLDGWHKMDIIIQIQGNEVKITYNMLWRTSKVIATNTFDTTQTLDLRDFFRIEQRHMAVYPVQQGITKATAAWIDDGRTLRTEVFTPVEVSQGEVIMRITTEYRVSETGDKLTLIELHSSRTRPLVYVFKKVPTEEPQ